MKAQTKDQLKTIGRPLLQPLLNRINLLRAQIIEYNDSANRRFDEIHHQARLQRERTDRTERRLDALESEAMYLRRSRELLDQLLDAVSSQNAVARTRQRQFEDSRKEVARLWETLGQLAGSLARVEQRGEFIRKEMLYELRYGTGEPGGVQTEKVEVIRPEALRQHPLKVNLGCGHVPLEGYVNVDSRQLEGVDVVAGVAKLPFDPNSILELRSSHLLEHFPTPQLERLLPYWRSLIAPGGTFLTILPDGESMVHEYAAGRFDWHNLKVSTFGGQEYDGDFHFAMYSADDLTKMLATAGFSDVTVVERGRPNGDCLEMELRAANGGSVRVGVSSA